MRNSKGLLNQNTSSSFFPFSWPCVSQVTAQCEAAGRILIQHWLPDAWLITFGYEHYNNQTTLLPYASAGVRCTAVFRCYHCFYSLFCFQCRQKQTGKKMKKKAHSCQLLTTVVIIFFVCFAGKHAQHVLMRYFPLQREWKTRPQLDNLVKCSCHNHPSHLHHIKIFQEINLNQCC